MSHTPGPWKTAIVDHGDMKQVETIHAPNVAFGRSTFHVVLPGSIAGRSYAECDANARLIAAAPDLLEALKRVRQAFYVDGTAKALRAAFEGTKEIVSRAEGRF